MTPEEIDAQIGRCLKIAGDYIDGHPQIDKIMQQVEELKKRKVTNGTPKPADR
jgi:hypothetical protein